MAGSSLWPAARMKGAGGFLPFCHYMPKPGDWQGLYGEKPAAGLTGVGAFVESTVQFDRVFIMSPDRAALYPHPIYIRNVQNPVHIVENPMEKRPPARRKRGKQNRIRNAYSMNVR